MKQSKEPPQAVDKNFETKFSLTDSWNCETEEAGDGG